MLIAVDIETEALDPKEPDNALIPHLSRITCIGVWCPAFQRVYRNLEDFQIFLDNSKEASFVGQNFKFDLKHLNQHGISIPLEQWQHDTQLMAATLTEKIPEEWLTHYEEKRLIANKKLPHGYSHRKARGHSLKTLAPYFLGVKPFWETPHNHDNDEYVLKDCEYTYRLSALLEEKLNKENSFNFYSKKLMPWAKMLLTAELRGININVPQVETLLIETNEKVLGLEKALDEQFKCAYFTYKEKCLEETAFEYNQMKIAAIGKLKDPSSIKVENINERYSKLLNKAASAIPAKCNLASPKQLLWILKDFMHLDCTDFNGKEGTGIEVLEKLKIKNPEINTLISYREHQKLATSFLPTYLRLNNEGRLHCTFNADGTRTGRLSSSEPNLQQVPGGLHNLFVARPGHKLITKDMSAIEPHLIAYYSEDPEMYTKVKEFHANNVRVFFDKEGSKKEIKELYPLEYALAKEVGLACLYGAGAKRIQQSARKYGVEWSLPYCKQLHRRLKDSYPNVFEFKEELDKKASKEPFTNLFGRKIYFTNPEDIYMQAFNTLIQSSASDMVLNSSLKIMTKFKEADIKGQILLWVHDEIVVEVKDDHLKEAESIMDFCLTEYDLPTPFGPIKLEVEGKIGDSWLK